MLANVAVNNFSHTAKLFRLHMLLSKSTRNVRNFPASLGSARMNARRLTQSIIISGQMKHSKREKVKQIAQQTWCGSCESLAFETFHETRKGKMIAVWNEVMTCQWIALSWVSAQSLCVSWLNPVSSLFWSSRQSLTRVGSCLCFLVVFEPLIWLFHEKLWAKVCRWLSGSSLTERTLSATGKLFPGRTLEA